MRCNMESFFKTFFKSFKAGLADGTVGRTNADAEKGKVLGRYGTTT